MLLLALLATVLPERVAHAAPLAFITNQGSHDVSVLDLAEPVRVVATVPVGAAPAGVVASVAAGRVFVANAAGNSVSVIDLARGQVVDTFAAGAGAVGIDASADGRRLFVVDWYGAALRVFDARSHAPLAQVDLGAAPAGVVVNGDGSVAWVAERDDDRIARIEVGRTDRSSSSSSSSEADTAAVTARLTDRIGVGSHPFALLLDAPRQRLYALNVQSDSVSVIDTATRRVIATLATGHAPYGAALADGGRLLYVTNQHADSVSVFDADTLAPLRTLTGFGYPEGIAAHADRVYVVNWMDDNLQVLDARSGTRLQSVDLGRNPRGFGAFIAATDALPSHPAPGKSPSPPP
ncbi:MAG: YncE family protein [Leptothrix sp. (in: b-proteobacteria)]